MRVILRLLVLICASLVTQYAAEIHVFAAASLTDALKEIAATYAKDSGDKVVFNFAGSNFLARQIEAGAPADIFFSADEAQMNRLEKQHLVAPETRRNRLSNSLVIVVENDSGLSLVSAKDLAGSNIKRLALADPAGVPAGIYAKQFLQKQNLWSALEKKIVPTENVRAALAAVESGNVQAAIVYKTDAAISKKTEVAFEIPTAEAPPIHYPVALLKDARDPLAAKKFLEYIFSSDATSVFRKYGFLTD
jgi:molybdate transport system substrate-binding protein